MTSESPEFNTFEDLTRKEKDVSEAILKVAEEAEKLRAVVIESGDSEENDHEEERREIIKLDEQKTELERQLMDITTRLRG